MASLEELFDLHNVDIMRNKTSIAITVSADKIRDKKDNVPPFDQTAGKSEQRYAWVKNANAFYPSRIMIQSFWNAILAANNELSANDILNAPDSAIQNNVDAVIDIFANGESV